MKKRAILIAAGAAILAAALTLAFLRTPSMHVASVDPERVVLDAGGDCRYVVWINHAHARADCRYYDGVRVISGTSVSRLTVYWDALDLYNGMPASGDCFCGFWYCRSEAEYHGGELWAVVVWRLWLPLVVR